MVLCTDLTLFQVNPVYTCSRGGITLQCYITCLYSPIEDTLPFSYYFFQF